MAVRQPSGAMPWRPRPRRWGALVLWAAVLLAASCVDCGGVADDVLSEAPVDDDLWKSLLSAPASALAERPDDGDMLSDAAATPADDDDDLWNALMARETTPTTSESAPPTTPVDEDESASPTVMTGGFEPPAPGRLVTTAADEDADDGYRTPQLTTPPGATVDVAPSTRTATTGTPAADDNPDAVSLAFVFDSTGSMWGDLEQLKRGAAAILATMLARPDKPIHDYVFVPFNDPAVGPASVTTDPDEFRAQLEAVQVRGGLDCPEPSLSALLEALKLVRPNSFIYVFTDASAKDHYLLDHVLALVQRKQTQVVFVMTGNCKDGNTMRYQSMENIAAASSGQIYHINKAEVENVLSFVRQTLDSQKVNLVSIDLPEAGKKEHAVQVDETIREFTVSVSGEHPYISVVNPDGVRLDSPPALQNILDLDNVKVVAVKEPIRGSWTVETSSDSKHAVRLTGLSVVDFAYGFSAQVTGRLDETYHRPLLDATNFILVGGTDMGSVWNLTSVDLLAIDGSTLQSIPLTPLNALDGLYRGGPFVPPQEDELFYLANFGYGKDGYPIKRITPTAISAQAGGLPTVNLQAEQRVWLNGSLNLRCQIDSLVPFTAWFFKNGIPISKKQKYQQTALMTMKIDGLTEEMGGDYVCRASNVKGFSKDVAHVLVTGPPPEVITESQVQSRPHQQVVLDCFVKSKLKFNVTWIRINPQLQNDVEFVENNARYIVLPNSSLVIDPALPEDSGLFSCVAENKGGKKDSQIQVTVYEPLHISVYPTRVNFQKGDSFSITCEANSLPTEFYWEIDGQRLQKKSAGHVTIESTEHKLILYVKNAKLSDQAVYRCVGKNERESVDTDAEAYYVEIPSVTIENNTEMVKVGDQVLLKCIATGIPKPTTRWLWQGTDVKSVSNFKVFEDGSLEIYDVHPENSGQLDCVAHNSVGEVKDSVNLTVGLPPTIVKEPSVLQLEIQGSGMLVCNGHGFPVPTIHWERNDGRNMDSSRVHHDVTTGALLFTDAQIDDGGSYMCVVQNKYGHATAEGNVVITGVVPPELEKHESEYQDVSSTIGRNIQLTCQLTAGHPAPLISWFKDGNHIDPGANLDGVTLLKNGTLIIHGADLRHSGRYRCEATNVGGSVSRTIQLSVLDPPVLDSSDMLNLTEKVGNNVLLPCRVHGTPQPDIQWLRNENIPIALTERILRAYEGLVIIGTQLEDAGKYTCRAVNAAGSANRSIDLIVQDPPYILGEAVLEVVANVGDIIRLPCNATGEPSPEYLWSHNYEYFSYNDHILPSLNSDGLIITSVDVSDGGEYLCSAVNDAGSANKTITVIVQEHPCIDTSDPSQVVVTSGHSAKLICRAKGIPPPSIVWTFKGQSLMESEEMQTESEDHSLLLPNVNESHSGSYICTAYNLAGSDSRAVKLVVQVAPTIEPWQDQVKVMEGHNLLLDCHMYGIPVPQGSWFRNGQQLSNTLATDSLLQYKVVAKLSDAGRYECRIFNEVGNTTRAAEVIVLAPPQTSRPSNMPIETVSGNDVLLVCITPQLYGYPPPTVKWTFDRNPVDVSDSSDPDTAGTLSLKKILPSQAGVYICVAQNEAGNSSRTFNISVHEPPLIQENFMERKTLMEGEDFSIPCSASGIPTPSISWKFNNHTLSSSEEYDDILLMNDNTLVIFSAQANTSGTYTCAAQNGVGEDQQQTYIEVYVPPTMTSNDIIHKEKEEGDDTVLTCPSSDGAEIEWRQNGKPINFTANERSDEAHFKLQDGGKNLTIFELRATDSGTYTCTASNPVGSKSATFHLEVLWKPFFEDEDELFGDSLKELTIIEGNSVVFDCLSSGSPTPKVIWRVNDTLPVTEHTAPGVVVLPSSRHNLTIPSVRAHHEGLYKCQAINKIGSTARKFLLHVIVPPYVDSGNDVLYEVVRGDTVNLNCPVKGSPKPVYTWNRFNSSLQFSWDRSNVQFQNDSQILVIPDIDFSDGGFYICNGSNQAGFKLKYFNVSVTGFQKFSTVSEAPSILNAAEEEEIYSVAGGLLPLECTAHGQPLPDIQWTHNGHLLPSDNTRERFDLDTSSVTQILTVDFSGASSSGRYVCHATNNRGAAEKVYHVHHQVAPRMNGDVKTVVEHLTSVHGLPFSMQCLSDGEPTPVISWFKDGTLLKSDEDVVIGGGHGETLQFKHSHESQSGNYTCEAKNDAGAVSKIFLLDVFVPPSHPNNTEEVKKFVLRHEPLNLHCDFNGHPVPKLTWIKGIKPISMNHTVEDLYLTDANRTLIIPSAELTHAGRYSCLAHNEAGSAELMFHVQVSEPPQRNEAVTRNFSTVTLRPLRRFMLLCAMTGSPPPNTMWFKGESLLDSKSLNGSIQISSDGRQLHILSALQEHEGLYRCHAENTVGSSSAYFQLVMDAEGDWGDWSDWSFCSVSCGFGTQERSRECLTTNCPGDPFEIRPCFMSYCPVNGGWTNWTEWTQCEHQCGQSTRNRSRECNSPEPAYGGLPCEGNKIEIDNCDLLPCLVNGAWSAWSEWSKCSVTCGSGVQVRHRYCNNPEPAHGGKMCTGFDTDVTTCSESPCSGIWSEWSDWTPCSASCGPGRRQRRRKCNSQWSECIGDNQQYEYCKLRRCAGDGPRKANLRLRGNLNGYNIRDDTLYLDISGDEGGRRGFISTRLHTLHKREVPLEPIIPLLVSPVSWNVAYEDKDARNGYSLTKGYFNQDSQVQFATGQEMKMKHLGQGVDSSGELRVEIEVIGEVPYVQPRSTIVVQPFSEYFVQTGANTLYSTSEAALSVDGQFIPYSWNSTLSYEPNEGSMPYLSEKLSTDPIVGSYDSDLQEMRYTVSTVISKSFDDNKCPEGFKLNSKHQHCEDIDECLHNASNKCHSTQFCENLLGSYRCSCPEGFRSLKIGSRCLDVNECLQEPPLCSHDCRNVPGSYHCICPPGTYLLDDRHSCSASSYWDDPDGTYGKSDVNGGVEEEEEEKGRESEPGDLDLYDSPQEFRRAEEEWSCAAGLIWRDGQCLDQDECLEDPDICGEEETCLNMHKTFKCLYTPCGDGYTRDPVSRDCITSCQKGSSCVSGAKIAEKKVFMAITLDPSSNQPGMDVAHLSVSHDYISSEKLISHTKYYFESNYRGKPFTLRQELGKCVLQASKKLKPGKVYRIEVRGDTSSENSRAVLFSTNFTLFFHVLMTM